MANKEDVADDGSLSVALRRSLYRLGFGDNKQQARYSVLVTSAVGAEGKTSISAALAKSYVVERASPCLVIDTSWKDPDLHRWFKLERNYNSGDLWQDPKACIQKTANDTLDVLTAPKDADACSEFRDIAQKWTTALDVLQDQYDMVIFDGASVLSDVARIDPLYMASRATQVIMVVMTRQTSKHELRRAKIALEDTAGMVNILVNNHHNRFYA